MGSERRGFRQRPAYALSGSWAQLRAAMAGFPDGTVFQLNDLWGFGTQWIKKGAYLYPENGHAVILAKNLGAYTTTATTLSKITIPTADLPLIPFNDLMVIPGVVITSRLRAYRAAPNGGAAAGLWLKWDDVNNGATFARIQQTNTNGLMLASGDATYYRPDPTQFIGASWNASAYYEGIVAGPAWSPIPAAPSAPSVWANTGGTGETITLEAAVIEMYVQP
jgi:hypothetical protein